MLTSDYTQEQFKPLQFIRLILEYSLIYLLMEISTSSGMEAVTNKLLLSDDKNTNKIL